MVTDAHGHSFFSDVRRAAARPLRVQGLPATFVAPDTAYAGAWAYPRALMADFVRPLLE